MQTTPNYFAGDTNNDRWILEQVFNYKRGGYFFEAGACDGVEGSNTFALESQFSWTGICCEPSNQWFSRLQQNRRCICDNSCLSGKNEKVTFIEAYGWGGIHGNLSEKKSPHWGNGVPVEKETKTLEQVLDFNQAPKVIDYLCLDLEGSEYAVLDAFNFKKYTFLAITIEGDSCTNLLLNRGYVHVRNPFNTKASWENYYLHSSMFSDATVRRLLGVGE